MPKGIPKQEGEKAASNALVVKAKVEWRDALHERAETVGRDVIGHPMKAVEFVDYCISQELRRRKLEPLPDRL